MAHPVRVPPAIRGLFLSYTRRWVIAPTLRDQSVAEHTFRVCVIARCITQMLGWPIPEIANLMLLVMDHDLEEHITGDIPGPQKSKQAGYLKDPLAMSAMERVIKVADSIETGTFWVQWGSRDAWFGHPSNNAPVRDIEKIIHYAKGVEGLADVAASIWLHITGEEMMAWIPGLSTEQTSTIS